MALNSHWEDITWPSAVVYCCCADWSSIYFADRDRFPSIWKYVCDLRWVASDPEIGEPSVKDFNFMNTFSCVLGTIRQDYGPWLGSVWIPNATRLFVFGISDVSWPASSSPDVRCQWSGSGCIRYRPPPPPFRNDTWQDPELAWQFIFVICSPPHEANLLSWLGDISKKAPRPLIDQIYITNIGEPLYGEGHGLRLR